MAPVCLVLSLLVAIALTPRSYAETLQACYFYDGTVKDNATPCNQSATNSACCDSKDICLSNGYCLQVQEAFGNRLGTPTCTDRSWDADECPIQCQDAAMNGPVSLYLAHDTGDGVFCCGGDYPAYDPDSGKCSAGPSTPFPLHQGQVIYNRTDGSILQPNTVSHLELANGSDISTVTVTATSIATTGVSKDSNSNITAVAAGIAAPLGVLLIAALAACGFLYHRLRSVQRAQGQQPGYPMHPASPYEKLHHQAASPGYGTPSDAGTWRYNYPVHQPPQLDGTPVQEAPTDRDAVEVDGRLK